MVFICFGIVAVTIHSVSVQLNGTEISLQIFNVTFHTKKANVYYN
uniref:Uncharacterized protein n=1 Tax=Anguilla anguilla TaxID=7936 RepID=A0A0E9WHM1_ANGAN